MDGLDAAPLAVQVLQDQAPVAVFGPGLAAQQHHGNVEEVSVQSFLDPTLAQEIQERALVGRPSTTISVGVEDLTRRGERGLVDVFRVAEPLQEEREVGATGEAGEPGGVVQTYVEQTFDAGVS
jgi:hypothetical protein